MIKQITVLGAGTMGHGVAETFAIAGYTVNLQETYEPLRLSVKDTIKGELHQLAEFDVILKDSIEDILSRIHLFDDLEESVIDSEYVIESISEEINMKKKIFKELDEYCDPGTILASNTSSFTLEEMISNMSPERKKSTMICHWYNPAHIMPLVEIYPHPDMNEEDYEVIKSMYEDSGKQVAKVNKDIPGLLTSRINMAVAREIFSLMEEEAADPQDIDNALKYGPALSYATTGQLEVTDLGGLDIWSTVGDNLLAKMDNSKEANQLLKSKVRNGKLGMKSGEGFYKYDVGEKARRTKEFYGRLLTQSKVSKEY